MATYQFVSEWAIDGAPAAVFAVLSDFTRLPLWWAGFESAEHVGETLRYVVKSPLGLRLAFAQHTEALVEPCLIQFRATGDLEGVGVWSICPAPRGRCRVFFAWNVDFGHRLYRLLGRAPFGQRLLRWSHDAVMAAGERGLKRRFP